MPTIGFEFSKYEFLKYDIKDYYKIFDFNGLKISRSSNFYLVKDKSLIIFVFSLYDQEIEEDYIDNVRENIAKKNAIIYLVGHKMDFLIQTNNNFEEFVKKIRNKIKSLINQNKISKYFEVDAKSGEGIEILKKNIEFALVKKMFN